MSNTENLLCAGGSSAVAEPQAPTPRELEILKVLWEHGSCSVREVRRRLDPAGAFTYNTFQTLLKIMQKKGLVTSRVEGRALIYTAVYSRDQTVRGFLDRVFDGAADQLVQALLRVERLSPRELEHLQAMIRNARKNKQGR